MNRAMFSGVAGLKTHQTKMDVIGNNVANVNTYGYKAQRAVFSDVYYQTLSGATEGTANQGGTNPSSVGYGSTLAAVQAQMSTSSMQSTGFGLDVAIAGEGFLQVMDPDGNIFYTKAGLLDYDANGYLIDINGNFVLGSVEVDGAPNTQKIKLDDIGIVPAQTATAEVTINNIDYTVGTSNATEYGDVSLTFSASNQLPAGLLARATISSTGSVLMEINENESFTDLNMLNSAINAAILEANGGVEHPAGTFTVSASQNPFVDPATGLPVALTGAQIIDPAGGIDLGTLSTTEFFGGVMKLEGVSSDFAGTGTITPADFVANYDDVNNAWNVSLTIGGEAYTGVIDEGTQSATLLLKSANGDYVEVTNPGMGGMNSALGATPTAGATMQGITADITATPSTVSPNMGFGSQAFTLEGGTEGGPVDLNQLSGIAIGQNGTISVTHAILGTVAVGKLSLATFANPSGLQLEGSNYYSTTVNSGVPFLTDPGSNGTGSLMTSTLEMSNVDLSEQFAEMITTQRGFQANSRIITVTDTMLEELINLKR